MILSVVLALLLAPLAAMAQTATGQPTAQSALPKDQLVTIDFNNVDIGVFIKFISELTGENFVVDQRVRGNVTIISPSQITIDEAYKVFESVLEVHGYATVRAGKVIKIVPSPEARTKNIETLLKEESGLPRDKVVTQIIRLEYADPEEIRRLFAPLISKSSVILAYPSTSTLIVTDVQSNIQRLLRIINAIDVSGIGQEITIIPLQNADAEKLVKVITKIFTATTKTKKAAVQPLQIVDDSRTNSIILLASQDYTQRIKQLVRVLDKETPKGQEKVRVFYLEHADAEELAKVLQDIPQKQAGGEKAKAAKTPLLSGKVRVTADKATNSLIITADKDEYSVIEELIRQLDIPRQMVYIEALFIEVDINADFNLGTEWIAGEEVNINGQKGVAGGGFGGGAAGGDPGYPALNQTTVPLVGTGDDAEIALSQIPLPPGFSLGVFGQAIQIGDLVFPNLGAIVQAYKKDRNINILSTPQIMTTDNQEAKITVGRNIPFQTKSTTTNNETFSSFEYRDVGQTLKITPQISKDRMVRLNVSLEFTALESTTDFRPTTLKRSVDTAIIVENRSTVVIGGLIDDIFTQTDYRVPCLGDLPGLGWLFRSMGKANTKTNLYVFISPRVIENPAEAVELYQQKQDRIDALQEESIKMYDRLGEYKNPMDNPLPFTEDSNDQPLSQPGENAPNAIEEKLPPPETDRDSTDALDQVPPATGVDNHEPQTAPLATSPPEENTILPRAHPQADLFPYTIQVAASKQLKTAQRLIAELKAAGYDAYLMTKDDATFGPWYRVRVGFFKTRTEGKETLEKLHSETFTAILIRR